MNQNPEQMARDNIDQQLIASGWVIQNKSQLNLNAATGVAVREYQTDVGPADYVLFVAGKPVGVIEAKREEQADAMTAHEDQAEDYAKQDLNQLPTAGLRDCQINAITKLELSFKAYKPRALIQMATGSGKTFTAITFVYRLLKYPLAKRFLFLVDTKNLGEQAEQEFMSYLPNDDNRKFTELYGVHRLKS